MPIEFHRDGPWDVPEGWVWARLRDVSREPGRIDPARQMKGQFTYIDLSAIDDGRVVKPQHLLVGKAPSRARQPVTSGDTLLSCVRVYLRNNAVVPPDLDGAVASTAFCVLRPTSALDPQFLFWFVHSRKFTETLVPLQRGNSPPAVLDDDVRDQWMPVPPHAEQRRIVARIDELFTEIEDGETALTRARNDLDTWRRALLKAAVTGELTREWRDHHKLNETGEDVVAQAASLKGQFGVQSRRRRAAHSNDDTDMAELPQLPEGWVWASLSDFSCASSYGTSVKCSKDATGVAVLRIPNVRAGRIDVNDLKWATADLDMDNDQLLDEGDLLIVRTNGSADLIGRAAIVDAALHTPTYFASYLIRFRIVETPSIRRWIALFFETPIARTWIGKNIASSAGQYNISQSALMRMPIPVPSETEITTALMAFTEMESIRTDAAADTSVAARTAPSLRQSILKAAFEGRLVEQDRSDEPAERLLSRLDDSAPQSISASGRRARRARGIVGADA